MQLTEQDRFNLYRLATSRSWAYCGARAIVNLLERVHKLEQAQQQQPQPKRRRPTVMEIVALSTELEDKGQDGIVDLVRAALDRWGNP